MSRKPSAATAPVEQRADFVERDERAEEVGVVAAALEKEPGVGVQRAHLRTHTRRR